MEEIKQLIDIVEALQEKYKHHNRKFTLDGKLIGDIGEVLAAEAYGLELYPENENTYDAYVIAEPKKKVQIKASMNGNYNFPRVEDVNYYFLCVSINKDGELDEVFNGSSKIIKQFINRELNKNDTYKIAENKLREMNGSKYNTDKLKPLK